MIIMPNKSIAIVAFLFLSLGANVASRAQVGTIEEAVDAAAKQIEPVYLEELTCSIFPKLVELINNRNIKTEPQILAFFRMMHNFVYTSFAVTEELLKTSPQSTAWKKASIAACRSDILVFKAGLIHSWRVFSFFYDAVEKNADSWADNRQATRSAIHKICDAAPYPFDPEAVSAVLTTIQYRALELWALNFLSAQGAEILEETYSDALAATEKSIAGGRILQNPFLCSKDWDDFRDSQYIGLTPEVKVFFTPWINVLNFLMSPGWSPQKHHFFSRENKAIIKTLLLINRRSAFGGKWLPKDLMLKLIIPIVMRANGELEPKERREIERIRNLLERVPVLPIPEWDDSEPNKRMKIVPMEQDDNIYEVDARDPNTTPFGCFESLI